MKIINRCAHKIDTDTLETVLLNVAMVAGIEINQLLVDVKPGRARKRYPYNGTLGRCCRHLIALKYKGRWVECDGLIQLYIFRYTHLTDLALTFAHELSHLQDGCTYFKQREPGFIQTQTRRYARLRGIEAPQRERRARAFADEVLEEILKG